MKYISKEERGKRGCVNLAFRRVEGQSMETKKTV